MIPESPTYADVPSLLSRLLSREEKLEVLRYDELHGPSDCNAGLFLSLGVIGIYPDKLNIMINIELSTHEITGPGLYVMQWQKKTGLVRIVGQPRTGYTIIQPENAAEHYFQGLPKNGVIPDDALLSEPLNVTKA